MLNGSWVSSLRSWKLWALAVILVLVEATMVQAFGWPAAVAVLFGFLGWGFALLLKNREKQHNIRQDEEARLLRETRQRLVESEQRRGEEERRLAALMQLNRGLAEAQDERAIMDAALSAITGLVGAMGCSFVPVDDWDQPLPAFTYGQLPEPVLDAWATHMASSYLRQRCGSCKLMAGPQGECPLHPSEVGNAMSVYCLPIQRTHLSTDQSNHNNGTPKILGILNLYLLPGRKLDANNRHFLEGLLAEIALAYESAHLRSQEMGTLRQIQMLHSTEGDFSTSLGVLLEGLKNALEADCVLIRLRPSPDERLSNLRLLCGDTCGLDEEEIEAIFTRVVAGEVTGPGKGVSSSQPNGVPVWLGLPLVLPEGPLRDGALPSGHVLGMLMASFNHPHEFHPRQKAVLQSVAAQVALLTENERLFRSLEYKVVIQERARLAREIHDGLAQTLAFLKLQAAQMQSYLAQGDLPRLQQVLKDNYQVLAEAYLDTRQAIDNLRLTPKEGLGIWIERLLREFEHTTGLLVERDIQSLNRDLTPEVQAQLIRIVQEALSNVRKHARARYVSLKLYTWQEELILEVCDDGLGFDADDVPEISQHGLRGMRERAEMIGADFQIISQALQGTTVRLVLPLSLEEQTTP